MSYQCARCGSSVTWEDCEACGGEGFTGHDCGEDSCCCIDPEPNVTCSHCDGRGAFATCLASAEWCSKNPRPGREDVTPETVEEVRP